MNIWLNNFIFIVLFASSAMQGAENIAQSITDLELYTAVANAEVDNVQQLLSKKANPNCDFPSISNNVTYTLARRPLVRALWNLEKCITIPVTEDISEEQPTSCLTIVQLLLEHKANPNVTVESGPTAIKAFEGHLNVIYLNKHLGPKLIPACKAIGLLLARGATTSLGNIHGLAKDVPELQRILKEYTAKLKNEIANATPLSTDPAGIVVRYVV